MSYIIEGKTGDWEVVIGLEIHAQIISQSKLFSGAATAFGAGPNTQVSLVDAAMPGMLPVINEECVRQAVKTGLGLKAKINLHSVFERKNYFYADLPQGYQISQYAEPVVGEGTVVLDMPDGGSREIGIERLHMEQDAGKSMHDQDPKRTFVDLNRSGVALMEIVSKPDLRTPEEAGIYLRKVRSIVRYLGTCDGNMEEGSMRADVNVSVRKTGETELRTRTEIKNLNSVRFVMKAIEHEAQRQVQAYDNGEEVVQETRLYDSQKGETRSMRSKEFAHDYRYFPDPDLLPVELTEDEVEAVRASLPELPDETKQRLMDDFGLTPYDAGVLVAEKETVAFFEAVVEECGDPKLAANWVINQMPRELKRSGKSIENSPVSPQNFGKLLNFVLNDTVSTSAANTVIGIMYVDGDDPVAIIKDKGLEQITDSGEIEAAVDQVIAGNPDQVADFQGGNEKAIGWFVGQVMKSTGGKANPKMVNELLRTKLKG